MANNKSFTLIPYKNKFLKFSNLLSGTLFYKSKKIDLLTNETFHSNIEEIESILEAYKLGRDSYNLPVIVHLFYELGYIFNNIDSEDRDDDPLLMILKFESDEFVTLPQPKSINLSIEGRPGLETYLSDFKVGHNNLLDGNCYQFNLTADFTYKFNQVDVQSFISKLWEKREAIGAYGHATYIESLNRMYLSNSPECLFQAKVSKDKISLETMPIKGSVAFDSSKDDFEKVWGELKNSEKNEAELYMITDLLRNDLSRIERPLSKVISKKTPLVVPGILHQYSKIRVDLSKDISLFKILKSLFPGGSITGAPKKRVMRILNNIEKKPRGIYCGSTLVLYKNIKAASINIRTADIDFNSSSLKYGAGGGVTLLSSGLDEFKEMELKVDSFIDIFRSK